MLDLAYNFSCLSVRLCNIRCVNAAKRIVEVLSQSGHIV